VAACSVADFLIFLNSPPILRVFFLSFAGLIKKKKKEKAKTFNTNWELTLFDVSL